MSIPMDLTQQERALLYAMTKHQGWEVMLKVMNKLCAKANEDVIKCDPMEDKKILSLQVTARAMSKFCGELIKNVLYNETVLVAEAKQQHEAELAGKV